MSNPVTTLGTDILTTQVGSAASITYEGASGIDVDNERYVISLDENTQQAISNIDNKLNINVFQDYSASVPTAMYSAGPHIDITDYVVSGEDWTDMITAASANAATVASGDIDTVSSILSAAIDYVSANAGTTGEYIPIANSGISAYGKIYGTNELELGSATPPTVKTFEGYGWDENPYMSWNYNVYVFGWFSETTEDTMMNWPVDVLQNIGAETYHIMFIDGYGYEKTFNIPSASVPYLSSVSFNGLYSIPGVTVTGWHESEFIYAEVVHGGVNLGVTTTGDTPTATVSVSAGGLSNSLYVKDGVASAVDFVTNNGISLSSITALGKTYTGVAPIVVDNVNDEISLSSTPFNVESPLYFVENTSSAVTVGLNLGISGVELVNSLPATAVSSVLYLIPEA